MRSGALQEEILVQRPTLAAGATGEKQTTWWTTVHTLFAERVAVGAAERWSRPRLVQGTGFKFRTRYVADLDLRDRILYGERAYGIVSVVDVDLAHRETLVECFGDDRKFPLFSYSAITVTAEGDDDYAFAWTTDAYATTKARYRKVGDPSWTETAHLTTRSFTHARSASGFTLPSTTYEVQVYGENAGGLTPGWSASKQWTTPAPDFTATLTGFIITKSAITAQYTTSANAKCTIYGALWYPGFDPEEEPFEVWFQNLTLHASPHSHAKTGLVSGVSYAVRIVASDAAGHYAYLPSAGGYYVVTTATDSDPGEWYPYMGGD